MLKCGGAKPSVSMRQGRQAAGAHALYVCLVGRCCGQRRHDICETMGDIHSGGSRSRFAHAHIQFIVKFHRGGLGVPQNEVWGGVYVAT